MDDKKQRTSLSNGAIFGEMSPLEGPGAQCPRGNYMENYAHDYDVADSTEGGPSYMFCGRCGRTYAFEVRF